MSFLSISLHAYIFDDSLLASSVVRYCN